MVGRRPSTQQWWVVPGCPCIAQRATGDTQGNRATHHLRLEGLVERREVLQGGACPDRRCRAWGAEGSRASARRIAGDRNVSKGEIIRISHTGQPIFRREISIGAAGDGACGRGGGTWREPQSMPCLHRRFLRGSTLNLSRPRGIIERDLASLGFAQRRLGSVAREEMCVHENVWLSRSSRQIEHNNR